MYSTSVVSFIRLVQMPNGKHSVIYVIREIVVLQCLPVFRCFLNTIRLLQKNLNCTNLHELRAYIYELGVTHLYFYILKNSLVDFMDQCGICNILSVLGRLWVPVDI